MKIHWIDKFFAFIAYHIGYVKLSYHNIKICVY